MIRLNDDHLKKVGRALTEAHRSRQEPSLGADWTVHVMRDIRREANRQGQSMMVLGLEQLVWRTAAVAAVLALVLTGSVLFYPDRDAVELTALLSNEVDVLLPFSE
ncbi:MAG: hypothetical protein EWM73_01585 [Nitrospira sp.]|nr:MAG: hypothetical protein EWM73_01585 [Nitrospira sp.]